MIEFDAVYYDGKTSVRKEVRVRALSHSLHISGTGVDLEVFLRNITIDPPIAGARRALHLPGEGQLQTGDHAAVEALFPRANRLEGWVHVLEQRWKYALAAAAATAAVGGWCVAYGIPLAAELAARLVPRELEAKLGEQTLRSIDGSLCKASKLDDARRGALRKDFAALTAGLDDGFAYRLEMRDCGEVGPNAFALPGGAVVLTDALVKLAQNDAQISAVLAHEIGHVRHHHGLRTGLQAAGVAALAAALAGDAASITGLAVGLPAALLRSGYSREFEYQADDFAFQRLRETGRSPKAFAEMMALLERSQKNRRDSAATDYFSTHPATAQRIERALAAAGP